VGNPGSLSEVRGSGDHIYKIRESDGIIQVQITKDDNTGDVLMVEIYRNGNLIGNYTRSAPRSSIEFLIDAKTGNPPGITTVVTPVTNRTGLGGGQVMYF
jgi:antitoxin component YwqK of YwqJK toxin-antitoxin module